VSTKERLVEDELVTTPVGFGYREHVNRLCAEAGVAAPISFESPDLPTIEGLVAAGLGIAITLSSSPGSRARSASTSPAPTLAAPSDSPGAPTGH
jgi:DNA-binding transcriptional LysR family regulator